MPKRLPPNNRPWPENMAFDFGLPPLSPSAAEKFIDGLATSERNKAFLRLRYREGKTYNEIADEYRLTATGVRLAVKAMWEKYGGSAASASASKSATLGAAEPDLAPQSAATATTAPAAAPSPPPPVANAVPQSAATEARPLSINLTAVRRFLNLTPEEFSRPMHIDSGESLINRLESGFSRPSAEILDLICEAWAINRSHLLTGTGEMFDPGPDYCSSLVCLLKRYLKVATFDRNGNQYWKGSLVDDLGRIIDTSRLDAPGMARVDRVIHDYLDVAAFEALLDRMGR